MSAETDSDLVERTLAGQNDAFTELVIKYQNSVFSLAYQKSPDRAEAEDIAQEAFLRAYQKLRSLKKRNSFGWWIYGITQNICREKARVRRPEQPLNSIVEPQTRPEDHRRDELLRLVGELPDTYRIPITLYFVDQMEYAKIAELLGIRETSVRSRVHRAKAMLREKAGIIRE
jgi:RNA polymerase sigma-70 factor (ECF subfamily)